MQVRALTRAHTLLALCGVLLMASIFSWWRDGMLDIVGGSVESSTTQGGWSLSTTDAPVVAEAPTVTRMRGVSSSHDEAWMDAHCNDGVQRQRNQTVARFLTTSKIHRKYGLTNVLLIAASMFAYASIDDRAVTFPKKSPVHVEGSLLDLIKTERCLAMANVRLVERERVDAMHLKQVSAWRVGLHLGSRLLAGATDDVNASALFGKLKMNMGLTHHIPIVSYGDFFLRFPFYAIRPLDVCFYLARMMFRPGIHEAAKIELHRMRAVGSGRFLALHLRLEADALQLDKRLRRIEPEVLKAFWTLSIEPLLQEQKLQSVYLCAGALDPLYLSVVNRTSSVPVFLRLSKDGGEPGLTTNHVDAAVDLLVASAATVAVSTERSTFFLSILSRRCPTPSRNWSTLERFRNSSLFTWASSNPSLLRRDDTWDRTRGNGTRRTNASSDSREAGVWSYQLTTAQKHTTLSSLSHVGCDRPWQGHCFYP